MTTPLRWLVVSDLHAGSVVSPVPKGFETSEGVKVHPNRVQAWMNAQWAEMLKWASTLKPFGLILNGDLIEGYHHRTTQVWSVEVSDHIRAAVQMLQPLCEYAQTVYVVEGTECHTGKSELGIGAMLGADIPPPGGWGSSASRMLLDIHGDRVVVTHHMPTSKRPWTRASALGLELIDHVVNAADAGEKSPRVVCMGHRHTPGFYSDGDRLAVVTPAWQGLTRYGHKVVPAARLVVGAMLLDWSHATKGQCPGVVPWLRRPPAG